MKHVAECWVQYDSVTGAYSYSPWYLARGLWGGRLVSEKVLERVGVPSYLGIAYDRWDMDALVMYPRPLHLIVRFLHYLSRYYWGILRSLYWVGLIDTNVGACFRWTDFYRIKMKP